MAPQVPAETRNGRLSVAAGSPRIAVIDYGMGNLFSVVNALNFLRIGAVITADAGEIAACDGIILPGVGAFGEAMANLRRLGLVPVLDRLVAKGGMPCLGICLGMQILGRCSSENGFFEGLGWIDGEVVPFEPAAGLQVPHVGWSPVSVCPPGEALFAGVADGASFYFDHSFHMRCPDAAVAARGHHGGSFVAAVRRGNIFGAQFHPEKSQRAGLTLLRNFTNYVAAVPGDTPAVGGHHA